MAAVKGCWDERSGVVIVEAKVPPVFCEQSAIGAPKAVELVAYSHATLFLPALSTLEKTLKCGYVRNFPGLTAKTLQRHPPRSVAIQQRDT
mmetsp:Transcript_17787/g.32152  ORF Transcript_17787/g.32152 Transcript_17787/m.32152 type:complete len:91 (-) Transcript_17787:59-331(-)